MGDRRLGRVGKKGIALRTITISYESAPVVSHYFCNSGILREAGRFFNEVGLEEPFFIITNPVVGGLYGDLLKEALSRSGLSFSYVEVPDGERYKTLYWARKLYDRMSAMRIDRSSTVLALGGGVICDLAGFVAATYMRGIPHAYIPTTLLAQVDASIGGKVGVDYGLGKNLIGSFYNPRLILCDPEVLHTLERRQFSCGVAEIIKSAIINSRSFFEMLEKNCPLSMENPNIEEIIYQTALIKADFVRKDPFEKNERAFLNFGHTIGHAIEVATGFRRILHGEAISIGMVGAFLISQELGYTSSEYTDRLKKLLVACGLPVKFRRVAINKIENAIKMDKKKMKDVRFILFKKPGEVFITKDVPLSTVNKVLHLLSN